VRGVAVATSMSGSVPVAGSLPPGAPPHQRAPSGELLLLAERLAWDVPGAAAAAFVRVRWPGGAAGGGDDTVLCLADGDAVDGARLRVAVSQSEFTRWVKEACGAVEVVVMDASQRVRIGAASLNLSELRFAAVSKALQPQRLPILSSGRPRGSLSLAASLSFDRDGQEFVHSVQVPAIPDNMARLGRRGKSPEDLFLLLGDFLDRDGIKVQSLFSICDKDKNGSLDKSELVALLEQMLGSQPSVLEMRFFWDMLDLDADGRVSYHEFALTVSDCRRARLSAKERGFAVTDLMRKLAVRILQSEGVSLRDAFAQYDADGSGVLEHREVVAMVRSLLPGISKREERLLLANMHEMDTDADGVISFEELEAALMDALSSALSGGRRGPGTPLLSTAPQMQLQASGELSPSQVRQRPAELAAFAATQGGGSAPSSPPKVRSLQTPSPAEAAAEQQRLRQDNDELRREVEAARAALASREAELAILERRVAALREAAVPAGPTRSKYLLELESRVAALRRRQEESDDACQAAWEGFKDSVGNFAHLAGSAP